ncbi:uncharacterized protein LOC116207461 [Punica granatum]|uniref:Protein RNA-directed DNA methylation 3 n=2 Tax=Punica granatum TaxID=22663 RepID=A0A218XSL7_PUNGR|nr:uncharacterized protein LOC116207461 [Punica granatum]OWM87820.1 hypothetical protein CDL15_Pgr019404 [Punica granatum]PKI71857.1 hypothetical protein CRG98_007716 [Punica granatum]
MASHLIPCQTHKHPSLLPTLLAPRRGWNRARAGFRIRVSDGADSYLDMWKKAVNRERKSIEFQNIADNKVPSGGDQRVVDLEAKSVEFQKLLEVPREERDRVQRMQVIDRAAAAIAAARSVIQEKGSLESGRDEAARLAKWDLDDHENEEQSGIVFLPASEANSNGVPGPDFWSWTPPSANDQTSLDADPQAISKPSVYPTPTNPVIEKERSADVLSIPFESKFRESVINPLLLPLQSLTETEKLKGLPSLKEDEKISAISSANATEAADALGKAEELPSSGVNPDGSRWWGQTGIEKRPDGVICRWTLRRGVSADQVTEWQEKFWEASDEFGYKELGSEKSGRDSHGNVWREFWRESMRQEAGLVHLEKTADKWGKNGKGEEWQEKWWEHYDASGQADKWAHKWCSIDPKTPLEAGHAHVWHERWGEKYDGCGGSTKYTDKWAERCEDGGGWWSKWGDKWDENFDPNGHGVKQGEKWWQGGDGSRWNRTWGEHHNGSGWVHKYGKSSCGEHWDTHAQQETWYERFPHFGFYHCFDNSVQLREVPRPSEILGD